MAIETNGFKDYLGTLPQQSDVDSIMAKDASGNPIWIKKADLAQVAAELMPEATADRQGVVSPYMLRNIPQPFVLHPGEAQEIIRITSSYSMFVCSIFCTVGVFANNVIINGRSNHTADNISLSFSIIKKQGYFGLYRKNNCFYIYNSSKKDGLIGFALSSQFLGTEIITIDDTYTEISIE